MVRVCLVAPHWAPEVLLSSQLEVILVTNTWLFPCVTRVVTTSCTKSRISPLISSSAAFPSWVRVLAQVECGIGAPLVVLLFFLDPDAVGFEVLHFIPCGITTDCSSGNGCNILTLHHAHKQLLIRCACARHCI